MAELSIVTPQNIGTSLKRVADKYEVNVNNTNLIIDQNGVIFINSGNQEYKNSIVSIIGLSWNNTTKVLTFNNTEGQLVSINFSGIITGGQSITQIESFNNIAEKIVNHTYGMIPMVSVYDADNNKIVVSVIVTATQVRIYSNVLISGFLTLNV